MLMGGGVETYMAEKSNRIEQAPRLLSSMIAMEQLLMETADIWMVVERIITHIRM